MSRISRSHLAIPSGITCSVEGPEVSVKGAKGLLRLTVPKEMKVTVESEGVLVRPAVPVDDMSKEISALSGTVWRLIRNMMLGVSTGFEKNLELIGVGYRGEVVGNKLRLALGYSNDRHYDIPSDITIQMEKPTLLKIMGTDKQRVGQVASELCRMRPPEPYKGKGIRVVGAFVHRKEGKSK